MCGVLGFVGAPGVVDPGRWVAAQAVQVHRGPDDAGVLREPLGRHELGLAHQRLAILDLSPAAHQPMGDRDRLGLLVFNGEIYNYLELQGELQTELRAELGAAGLPLSGGGDTRVLLQALAHWGPAETVRRLNGMWAFAWLEPGGRRLWLSRDRAGEKPLYWVLHQGALCFASEVKTLLTLTGRRCALDLDSVGRFLVQSVVDCGTGSFFAGIEQVPAAALARVDLAGGDLVPRWETYWRPTLQDAGGPVRALAPDRAPDLETRLEHLRETFLDSVRLRLRSDVPVGILLSGGLDSSAIAAAAQRLIPADGELNLLAAVTADPRFDESPHIDRMAAFLGRPVARVSLDGQIGSDSLFQRLERAIWHNDAPVGSLSNLAHQSLMALARERGITVVLSGQGADELLCGYKKYLGFYLQSLARQGRLAAALGVAWQFWRNGTVINQFNLAEARRYLPAWLRPPARDLRGPALGGFRPLALGLPPGADVRARQAADLSTFSIPVLTHFEDRMSMSEGREVRLPFLDPRLMDLLIATPTALKLGRGWTKYLMRRAVEPWLPPQIAWRKDKRGFVNPEEEWLKGRLRDQVLGYFAPDSLIFRYHLVDRPALLETFAAYCRQPPGGGAVWFREVFNPLALELWLRRFEPYIAPP